MPIDSKGSSAAKSVSTGFGQSNSLYSFNSKSASKASSLPGSKSTNCLSNGLIENEELIEKLFPKCRPKSKASPDVSSAKSDRTNGSVIKISPGEHPPRHPKAEMLNTPGNGSSVITESGTSATDVRKVTRKSGYPGPNFQSLQGRRFWNFMDISPSPSPPPLSPIESMSADHHFAGSDPTDLPADKLSPFTPSQERPSLVGQYQPPSNFDNRDSFKTKGRFDINSLEVNPRSIPDKPAELPAATKSAVNLSGNSQLFSKNDTYFSSNDGLEKSSLRAQATNLKHAGAHFRLDSLLLSPEEPSRETCKVSKLPNGIKKTNRFSLDCDLNDEDDVLFSRINPIPRSTSNGGNSRMVNSAKSAKEYQQSGNVYSVDRSSRDRSIEAKSQILSSLRETSVESTRSRTKAREEADNMLVSKGPSSSSCRTLKEDSISDAEELEEERDSSGVGKGLARNRIELAGGKEIVSSSRSTRAKRRSPGHGGSSKMTVGVVSSESRHSGSFPSRHTQLYSVSMAADNAEEVATPIAASQSVSSTAADQEQQRPTSVSATGERSQQKQHNMPSQPVEASLAAATTAIGNDSSPVLVVTGNQTVHPLRAHINQITSVATGEANQRPESISYLPDDRLQANESTEAAERQPSALDNNTGDQAAKVVHEVPMESIASAQQEYLSRSVDTFAHSQAHVRRQSSHEIVSSLYKATTMTLEAEVGNSRMSSRDTATSEAPESLPSHLAPTGLDALPALSSRPESNDRSLIQGKEALRARPIQEQDLCSKLEQSVNLSCDQFARDLKKRLDKVSSSGSNSIDSQHECELAPHPCPKEALEVESDNTSVKSASLSAKSFDANERIARVIGNLPIAQYEGSPKRYGPKPGYPKRVLSTSSNNSNNNDYETILVKKSEPTGDDMAVHKSTVLSSENGSPHSSTSSATFSSTDIHSSSSFSCPSNQKSNGFSNWSIQTRLKENYQCPSNDFSRHLNNTCDENCSANPRKVEPTYALPLSSDEIVKTILSLPSGQIDTEDDGEEDVTSSSDKPPEMSRNDGALACESGRAANEPIYSSIASSSGYSADPNKSSGYSSKRSLHSDDSESVTKSKTSLTSSSCDRNINRSATSLKAQFQPNEIGTRGQAELTGTGAGNGKSGNGQLGGLGETVRNVPKSLRLENYQPRHLEAAQSFDSTDSSYRSEKYAGKEYGSYYGQSDDDLYPVTAQKSYPSSKLVPGSGMRVNGTDCGRNLLDPLKSVARNPLSYTCLSPELTSQEYNSQGKLCVESTYESAGEYPSDQCESYSETLANNKGDTNGVTGTGGRINTMPVLEDGLSSGVPSSDEMDYEEEEEEDAEDDLMTHEHDLDEYVNEYNNSRSVPCDPMLPGQYASRLEMLNGNGGPNCANYGYHYKQQAASDFALPHKSSDQSQPLYRCATKTSAPFGLELPEEVPHQTSMNKKESHDFYNGHSHHLSNHHMHNHPIMDDNSRVNVPSTYENGKHSQSQEAAYGHDKFCLSSQIRSISNSSSNNSSMSTVRNASGQVGPTSGVKSSSPPPPPPPAPSHLHYHHYYHNHQSAGSSGQTLGSRQNYPNLSNSPTSLGGSPNSPGALHQQSSASSSSSSSHPASAAPHHYHQQPTQGASQLQEMAATTSPSSSLGGIVAPNVRHHHDEDCDTDQETDRLLGSQRNEDRGYYDEKAQLKRSSASREAFSPKVLIEGVLFRARYLGSTQLVCDGQPTKATRMMQAEEAVSRIKAPEGETQPSTEVDLFISTEKIMVLNTDLKEIMMDHALRTISYIADIGDLLVLMARRRTPIDDATENGIKRIPKMICHVFESEEAQYIAQSIGQAFQVAYMEFLKANGIEDSSFLKEMDYQEVLNSQEIFGNELEMFAKRERQKEVIVPKQKGEILGIVIVESGWGSMLPTVVIANMAQSSPSARCGQLNIGDQIIAINGISLVGLPLSACQAYVKNTKNQTAVKFTIVPCAPVVEVKIKRPDTKYQLGFSVQNGVICSLLRGGIAERGGVRVGHRIIEINGQSVVAVPHDRIVNLLATSVGEIHMKTMPTSMFRLLTGQDSPSYL